VIILVVVLVTYNTDSRNFIFDVVPTYKLRTVYVVQEVIARNQQYIHPVNCWPCSGAELAGYVVQVVAM